MEKTGVATGARPKSTPQQPSVATSSPPTLSKLNYRSPQQTYEDSLNFDNDVANQQRASVETQEVRNKLRSFMANINNSDTLYPVVALIFYTLTMAIMLFQKMSGFLKFLLVVIYLMFLVFTIMTFKSRFGNTTTATVSNDHP